jgi:hypothetical protein
MAASTFFLLGYAPPLVGIYFHAVELLTTLPQDADPPLAARVQDQVTVFAGRGDATIVNVRLVAALLQEVAVAVPPPPRVPADYYAWAQPLLHTVPAAVPSASVERAAYLLGYLVGDAMLTLNLGVLVHYLLAAAPQQAWLRAQAQALGESQASGLARLPLAGAHPALSAESQQAAATVRTVLAAAPAIAGGEAGETRWAALQSSLREVAEQTPRLEATVA